MVHCNDCNKSSERVVFFNGKNSKDTGFLFLLHSPVLSIDDKLISDFELFFNGKGKEISNILNYCKLSQEDVFIANFVKCPYPDNLSLGVGYNDCKEKLEKEIKRFDPEKMVIFSENIYRSLINQSSKENKIIYSCTSYRDIPALILPTPNFIDSLEKDKKIKNIYESTKLFLGR